jgi:hypothetical protein
MTHTATLRLCCRTLPKAQTSEHMREDFSSFFASVSHLAKTKSIQFGSINLLIACLAYRSGT